MVLGVFLVLLDNVLMRISCVLKQERCASSTYATPFPLYMPETERQICCLRDTFCNVNKCVFRVVISSSAYHVRLRPYLYLM